MLKWVKYITAAIALFRAVKEAVEVVEVPGYGPEKKQAVLDVVACLYDAGAALIGDVLSKEQVLDLAGKMIDVIVALKNLVGEFRHSTQSANPTQAPAA